MDITESVRTVPEGTHGGQTKSLNAMKSERQRSPPRYRRPNYAQIHSQPLPLSIQALPAFIPHNPLSLLRLGFAILSEYFYRPISHPEHLYAGDFSAETRSIHVTDPATARALWEKGFFGKGSLSRSEPNWFETERRRLGVLVDGSLASEERTNQRRKERLDMKRERAKAEAEAIQLQLRREAGGQQPATEVEQKLIDCGSSDNQNNLEHDPVVAINTRTFHQKTLESENDAERGVSERSEALEDIASGKKNLSTDNANPKLPNEAQDTTIQQQSNVETNKPDVADLRNQEHLQLSLEEAFFLTYGLGVLQINFRNRDLGVRHNGDLLQLFRRYSYFPPLDTTAALRPDDTFLVKYVVYHHFRSLGWVVRDGVKFAVDYLLYERGPAFKHAEFAIAIVPNYADGYWYDTEERRNEVERKRAKNSWQWLHCLNRVQTHVVKTLLLVYVDVPSPSALGDGRDIGKVLKCYPVREFCVQRFNMNRNR